MGPKPRGCRFQAPLPSIAPIPVRTTSPSGSTTSRPHSRAAWSPWTVYPTPCSSAFPTTLPHPRSGADDQSRCPPARKWSYRSKKRTPGSTRATACSSSTSSTRFIRRRLTTTDPGTRGAAPPYALLRPWETTHSGNPCRPASRRIPWTSATVSGSTVAEIRRSCHPANVNGSPYSRPEVSSSSTASAPSRASRSARAAADRPAVERLWVVVIAQPFRSTLAE